VRFEHPIFLVLLVVLVPLLLRRHFAGEPRGSVRFSDVGRFRRLGARLAGRLSGRGARVPFWLRFAAVILLVVALARPQSSEILAEEVSGEGVDIMLTLDVSSSMSALDLDPVMKKTRLDVVKEVAEEFIDARPYDRIGLVTFARYDETQSPLTMDHAVLKEFLRGVGIASEDRDGTALGVALARTLTRLKDSEAKSKIVILLTDGANNDMSMSPLTAAEIASSLDPKIKVYTIGAGSEGPAPVRVDTPGFGPSYMTIPGQFDEATLKEIARITGARYFRARDAAGLREIFHEIDRMEKTEIESMGSRRYSEIFTIAAFPAFLLLLLEAVLSQTRFRRLP